MADGLVLFCDLDLADDFEVFDDGLALVEDLTPADDCFVLADDSSSPGAAVAAAAAAGGGRGGGAFRCHSTSFLNIASFVSSSSTSRQSSDMESASRSFSLINEPNLSCL